MPGYVAFGEWDSHRTVRTDFAKTIYGVEDFEYEPAFGIATTARFV